MRTVEDDNYRRIFKKSRIMPLLGVLVIWNGEIYHLNNPRYAKCDSRLTSFLFLDGVRMGRSIE
jgi:hypothetical protein